MATKRERNEKKWDRHAVAIGHICIEWGQLENGLDEFIQLLAPLEAGNISNSVTAGMDVRTKIQTVKALAFIRKPSDRWFRRLTLVLDYIDNDVRVRRNRLIHDAWYIPKGRLVEGPARSNSSAHRLSSLSWRQKSKHQSASRPLKSCDGNWMIFSSRCFCSGWRRLVTSGAHCRPKTRNDFFVG